MNKNKSLVAILIAVLLISSLIACTQKAPTESVTQAVTNENGEIVTDENGELLTEEIEAQVVTDSNGNAVTEVVTDGDGKPLTTVKDGEYVNVTQNVTQSASSNTTKGNSTTKASSTTKKSGGKATTTKKATKKPAAPSKPSKITASDIGEDSVKLKWSSVKCTGYQVQYSEDGVNFSTITNDATGTSIKVGGLTSYTKYTFRVRAFNKKGKYTSTSKWVSTTATTKAANDSRYITFKVTLPMSGNEDDTLIIKIGKDTYEKKVKLNGSEVTLKTDKKYKGVISFEASLKNTGSSFSGKTDKAVCAFDLSGEGIYTFEGDDD